jgi:hypothetical protein
LEYLLGFNARYSKKLGVARCEVFMPHNSVTDEKIRSVVGIHTETINGTTPHQSSLSEALLNHDTITITLLPICTPRESNPSLFTSR